METEKEFKTVNGLILELLKEDERCRNDDKWLTYRVMRHFTRIFIPFEDFQKIPAFETIKRCRANIQNKSHLFLPTSEKIRRRRKQREKTIPKHLNSSVTNNTYTKKD